jgi:hypothetical protein
MSLVLLELMGVWRQSGDSVVRKIEGMSSRREEQTQPTKVQRNGGKPRTRRANGEP